MQLLEHYMTHFLDLCTGGAPAGQPEEEDNNDNSSYYALIWKAILQGSSGEFGKYAVL
jgi:hypothetical protein